MTKEQSKPLDQSMSIGPIPGGLLEVTCNNCGWVHFAVTRQYAENEVATFNTFYDSLPRKEQEDFYGGRKSSVDKYEHCFRCGNPCHDFSLSKDGDCPMGCTMQPIIREPS